MKKQYDFCGYATKYNIKCSDKRTIRDGAFAHCDGKRVPLCWGHVHDDPAMVLGHADLECRADGVYAYGSFNDTKNGRIAKECAKNGDIESMSIFANHLTQNKGDVLHGDIQEVSLVLAGANPGALIDSFVAHGDTIIESPDEAQIYMDDASFEMYHEDSEPDLHEADSTENSEPEQHNDGSDEEISHEDGGSKMADEPKKLKEVFATMNEEQMAAVYTLLALLDGDDSEGGEENMAKHNLFENDTVETTLSHDDFVNFMKKAKSCGSAREAFNEMVEAGELQHGDIEYGIENLDYLFPEARTLNDGLPEFIKRDTGWVSKVMSAVHHTPFAKIKSVFADITEDEARAKGYIKGNLKKEEFFSLIKRVTTPTTVYKKQKFDRDDLIDINNPGVLAWVKSEMRLMLDEELARAYLFGDGRLSSDDDKINETNIRPAAKDEDLYTIKVTLDSGLTTPEAKAKNFIRKTIKSRKDYKGSGRPILFCTEDTLTDMLLLTDTTGRDLYADESALCKKLRVSEIVTVEVMENMKGPKGGTMLGLILNVSDYNVGADKGGAVEMFDDFDIDYNQQKFLIETRCSGALTKPYSAIVIEDEATA